MKTILIADDDNELAALLARRCARIGLKALIASDAMSALREISEAPPHAAILDINMPCGNGLTVCEMMSRDDDLRRIPVIVLTGATDPDTVRKCHAMCAYYVPKCPDVWARVEPLLRDFFQLGDRAAENAPPTNAAAECEGTPVSIDLRRTVRANETAVMQRASGSEASASIKPVAPIEEALPERRSRPLVDAVFAMLAATDLPNGAGGDASNAANAESSDESSPWVLCIDDDPDFSLSLAMRLEEHGVVVQRAFAGMEGYRRAFMHPAKAIILDYEMPGGNGDYVLRRLKENPVTQEIPVIVLTGRREKTLERKMYNMGAAAFLNKPYVWVQLWNVLQRHLPRRALFAGT